jgi:hypothetical protein
MAKRHDSASIRRLREKGFTREQVLQQIESLSKTLKITPD